jgi:hypothetical protein
MDSILLITTTIVVTLLWSYLFSKIEI